MRSDPRVPNEGIGSSSRRGLSRSSLLSRSTRLGLIGVALGLGASLPLATVLGGCAASKIETREWPVSDAIYSGPRIDLVVSDDVKTIRVESPSPGWDVTLDGTERRADSRRLFVTLRRPNPQFVYPTVVVDQLVRTDSPPSEPATLFARVLEYGANTDAAYRRVAERDPG